MVMARIKKLKKNDINKNSSIEIKYSINKIREQERKYMAVLVVFFMVLFCVVGYFTLSFNKDNYSNDSVVVDNSKMIDSSPKVLLTGADKKTDDLGLNSEVYSVEINNAQDISSKYQLLFQIDDVDIGECECNNEIFNTNDIRYSLDGENAVSFSNNDILILKEATLEANEVEIINVRMWIDSHAEVKKDILQHLHGHFVIKEIK